MILDVSGALSDAMLDAVSDMIGDGSLELLSADSELLVTLQLSDPGAAIDGELEFKLAPGVAVASGEATSARVLAADGSAAFVCDVGDPNSNCVIKLKPDTQIKKGGVVALDSFRLVMP
jgi:hypothetical protein